MNTVLRNRVCKVCHHEKFTRDLLASSGDVLCMNCGSVVEENPIVSEVQFGESASGAAMVQGAMVGADQARANFNMRNAMDSREQTLLNAKKKIKKIASVMKIPDYIVESASGWFKLALVQNFVQGRRSQNVIAACLYVACRHERTPHLLIDFSSRLQISVYSLGSTYLKLVRALQIQKLPIADPSLFIQHFADRLQFGEKTAKVCRDATKLAHRMALDWIYEGRRPAGIAGACVLLAARMNKINRSHAEIVAVARVGEETIQKRLNEFKSTASGKLKLSEFRESEHTRDQLPPSYKKNRRIEEKVQQFLLKREQTLNRLKDLAKDNQLFKQLKIQPKKKGGEEVDDESGENAEGDNSHQVNEENSSSSVQTNSADRLQVSTETVEATTETGNTEVEGTKEADSATDSATGNASVFNQDKPSEDQQELQNVSVQEDQNPQSAEVYPGKANSSGTAIYSEATENADDTGEELNGDELFVGSDGDEYGYEDLPDDPHDETYRHRATTISKESRKLRERGLRPSTLGTRNEPSQRLDSIRREIFEQISEPVPKERRRKGEKERAAKEAESKREDALLKAVLDGGDFSEDDLEQVLDKFLKLNKESLSQLVESSGEEAPESSDGQPGSSDQIEKNRPRNLVANNPTTAELLKKVRDGDPDDEDEEDDDLNSYLLLDEQAEEKERIWIAINYDFLIAQEKKRLKNEADELTGNTSGQPKKRRRVKEQGVDALINDPAVADAMRQIGEDGRAMTPADSAKQIFTKKAFSRKINYGSITELFNS